MNFIKIFSASFALGSGLSSAFTVSLSNQSQFGDPSLPVLVSSGEPLVVGTVAVGFFDSDQGVTTNSGDFGALLSVFNEYGSSVDLVVGEAAGLVELLEPSNWTTNVPFGSTDPQVGRNIYVIFGSGSSLTASDQLAVWKADAVFNTEDLAGNGSSFVDLSTGAGSLLLGTLNGETDITGGPGGSVTITYSNSIGLVSVPEPSAALFMVMSALGFGLRRRRG